MNYKEYFVDALLEAKSKNNIDLVTKGITDEQVSDAWSENLFYKGNKVIDFYMKFLDWFEENSKDLKDTSWIETMSDEVQDDEGNWYEDEYEEEITRTKQESYMGYIPSKDTFVTGFDMQVDNDNPAGIVYWKTDGKKFKVLKEDIDYGSDAMYGSQGAYKKLQKKHKDLIDIRLD